MLLEFGCAAQRQSGLESAASLEARFPLASQSLGKHFAQRGPRALPWPYWIRISESIFLKAFQVIRLQLVDRRPMELDDCLLGLLQKEIKYWRVFRMAAGKRRWLIRKSGNVASHWTQMLTKYITDKSLNLCELQCFYLCNWWVVMFKYWARWSRVFYSLGSISSNCWLVRL